MLDVAALYQQHGPMVLRRARRILADDELSRDVVHDVFLTLHEQRERLFDGGLVSWLYVVTTHRCLKAVRARQTHTRIHATLNSGTVAVEQHRGDALPTLRQLLRDVPEELAAVAIYRFVDDMTHAEIARVLGCSRRHVGDLLIRFETLAETLRRTG